MVYRSATHFAAVIHESDEWRWSNAAEPFDPLSGHLNLSLSPAIKTGIRHDSILVWGKPLRATASRTVLVLAKLMFVRKVAATLKNPQNVTTATQ